MAEIDSYEYWMKRLAARSPATKEAYQIYLNNFLKCMKATPNQLIEMQRKAMAADGDPRENHVVEDKVRAWLADMKEDKSPSTRRTALSAVKSFFDLNYHPLRLNRLDTPQGESQGSRIPEREEVIRMADGAKWKYRAAIMFLKDSGLRVSDMVRVTWEDVEDMGEGFWNFRIETQKKGIQACAFVGPETTRLLEQFTNKKGRIFAASANAVVKRINTIARSVGIKGVTAHSLRKYFHAQMEHANISGIAKIPDNYILRMMGKRSSVYSENRRGELFQAYKQAYPELSIYQREQSEEIEGLKATIERLKTQQDKIMEELGYDLETWQPKTFEGFEKVLTPSTTDSNKFYEFKGINAVIKSYIAKAKAEGKHKITVPLTIVINPKEQKEPKEKRKKEG